MQRAVLVMLEEAALHLWRIHSYAVLGFAQILT